MEFFVLIGHDRLDGKMGTFETVELDGSFNELLAELLGEQVEVSNLFKSLDEQVPIARAWHSPLSTTLNRGPAPLNSWGHGLLTEHSLLDPRTFPSGNMALSGLHTDGVDTPLNADAARTLSLPDSIVDQLQ